MANSFTPFLDLTLLEVGANVDTWGALINANTSATDAGVQAAQDAADAASDNADTRVLKAGDTMTGPLVGTAFNLDANAGFSLSSSNPTLKLDAGDLLSYDRTGNALNLTIGSAVKLSVDGSGAVLAVPLTLPGAPTGSLHAATKAYVDTAVAGANANANARVPTSGGTITGDLVVNGVVYSDVHRFRSDGDTGWQTGGDGVILGLVNGSGVFQVQGAGLYHTAYGWLHDQFARVNQYAYFGEQVQAQGGNPRLRLYWPGGALWDVHNDSAALQFCRNGDLGNWKCRIEDNGNVTARNNLVAASDRRLKDDIRPLRDALDLILRLEGVRYVRTDDPERREQIGFIAQDVEKVIEEAVTRIDGDLLGVSYQMIIPALVEGMKALAARVAELEARG